MERCVMGIDPALSTTGIAIINEATGRLVYINKFTTSPKRDDMDRINSIVTELFTTASLHPVYDIAIEDGFAGPNRQTALQLATLRGAVMGVFAFNRYPVFHMLPSQVRNVFGCGGNANKEQVAKAVTEMYKDDPLLQGIGPYSDKQNRHKTSDMYDAVATAVAFIKEYRGGRT